MPDRDTQSPCHVVEYKLLGWMLHCTIPKRWKRRYVASFIDHVGLMVHEGSRLPSPIDIRIRCVLTVRDEGAHFTIF